MTIAECHTSILTLVHHTLDSVKHIYIRTLYQAFGVLRKDGLFMNQYCITTLLTHLRSLVTVWTVLAPCFLPSRVALPAKTISILSTLLSSLQLREKARRRKTEHVYHYFLSRDDRAFEFLRKRRTIWRMDFFSFPGKIWIFYLQRRGFS